MAYYNLKVTVGNIIPYLFFFFIAHLSIEEKSLKPTDPSTQKEIRQIGGSHVHVLAHIHIPLALPGWPCTSNGSCNYGKE